MSDSMYFFVTTSSKKPFHSKLLKSILKRNTEFKFKYDAYAEEKSNSISYWKIKHCDSLTLIRAPKIIKEDVVSCSTPPETISQQTIHKGQAFSNDQLEPLNPKFSHNQTSRKRRSRLSRPGNCILNIDCLGGIEDRFNGEIQHQSVIFHQFDDEDNLDRYPSTSTLNNVGEQKQESHDEGDGQMLLEDSYSIVLRNLLRLDKLINDKDQIFTYSQPAGDIIVLKSKSVKKITKCNMKGPKFLREQATSKIPKLATVLPKFSRGQTTSNISKLATVSPKFSRRQTTSKISKLATVSPKFSRGQTTSKISKLATVLPKFSRGQTNSNISKLARATVSSKFSQKPAVSSIPKPARTTVSPKFSQKSATSKLPKKLANLSPKFSSPITHAAKDIKPINSKDKSTQTAPELLHSNKQENTKTSININKGLHYS